MRENGKNESMTVIPRVTTIPHNNKEVGTYVLQTSRSIETAGVPQLQKEARLNRRGETEGLPFLQNAAYRGRASGSGGKVTGLTGASSAEAAQAALAALPAENGRTATLNNRTWRYQCH